MANLSANLWPRLKEALAARLEPEEHDLWIQPLVPAGSNGSGLILGCPNAFHLRWLKDHYLPLMRSLLAEMQEPDAITLKLHQAAAAPARPQLNGQRQLELPRLAESNPALNGRFVFDRFVSGKGNELAFTAAKALARGQQLFSNTLFLVSATGLGKSHLTQAVGHELLRSRPGTRVAYLTAEDFTSQMISALRKKRIEAFKERFRRSCDVLLLEEVQFLSGKEKTQEELNYALDALLNAGKKVVFTSYYPATQVKGLKPALESRMSGGVTVSIDPPDFSTRRRILERLAQEEGVSVPPEILDYLASEVSGDVRRLMSALAGLMAQGSLTSRSLDLSLASEVLAQMNLRLSQMRPERVRDVVARVYGLSALELKGKSRRKAVTRPRNLAMYLCRRHTEASYAAIGKVFGRDHTTVMYGVDKVERGLGLDPKLNQELSYLEQRLGVESS